MTNTDKLRDAIARFPGKDDDELSQITGITPRQQVNQICNRLAAASTIVRNVGPKGKIVNILSI